MEKTIPRKLSGRRLLLLQHQKMDDPKQMIRLLNMLTYDNMEECISMILNAFGKSSKHILNFTTRVFLGAITSNTLGTLYSAMYKCLSQDAKGKDFIATMLQKCKEHIERILAIKLKRLPVQLQEKDYYFLSFICDLCRNDLLSPKIINHFILEALKSKCLIKIKYAVLLIEDVGDILIEECHAEFYEYILELRKILAEDDKDSDITGSLRMRIEIILEQRCFVENTEENNTKETSNSHSSLNAVDTLFASIKNAAVDKAKPKKYLSERSLTASQEFQSILDSLNNVEKTARSRLLELMAKDIKKIPKLNDIKSSSKMISEDEKEIKKESSFGTRLSLISMNIIDKNVKKGNYRMLFDKAVQLSSIGMTQPRRFLSRESLIQETRNGRIEALVHKDKSTSLIAINEVEDNEEERDASTSGELDLSDDEENLAFVHHPAKFEKIQPVKKTAIKQAKYFDVTQEICKALAAIQLIYDNNLAKNIRV